MKNIVTNSTALSLIFIVIFLITVISIVIVERHKLSIDDEETNDLTPSVRVCIKLSFSLGCFFVSTKTKIT